MFKSLRFKAALIGSVAAGVVLLGGAVAGAGEPSCAPQGSSTSSTLSQPVAISGNSGPSTAAGLGSRWPEWQRRITGDSHHHRRFGECQLRQHRIGNERRQHRSIRQLWQLRKLGFDRRGTKRCPSHAEPRWPGLEPGRPGQPGRSGQPGRQGLQGWSGLEPRWPGLGPGQPGRPRLQVRPRVEPGWPRLEPGWPRQPGRQGLQVRPRLEPGWPRQPGRPELEQRQLIGDVGELREHRVDRRHRSGNGELEPDVGELR